MRTRRNSLLQFLMTALAIVAGASGARAAQKELDFAAEDAAYQTIKEMTQAELPVQSVAFIGLFGDKAGLARTFRAGLVRVPGVYHFYTRDEAEWKRLVDEIDFGNRRSDVMDLATIQSFGNVKGVQALLYGDVIEPTVTSEGAVVRLALTVANVTTGELLWTGNIVGRYEIPKAVAELPENLRRAALDAGRKVTESLRAWKQSNPANRYVFLLPLNGKFADELSDIVFSEVVNAGDRSLRFFTKNSSSADARLMRRLADDLASPSGPSEKAELKRIMQQLDQLFDVEAASGAPGSKPAVEKPSAPAYQTLVLSGRVTETKLEPRRGEVALNLNIVAPASGEQVWGANVDGQYAVDVPGSLWRDLLDHINLRVVVYACVALVVLLLLIFMVRGARRPR